jgi:phosphonate transport system substrate-binding protein
MNRNLSNWPSTAAGIVLLAAAAGASAKETLVIAVQPTQTPEQLSAQGKELEQELESQLGIDVALKFPTSYAGTIEALRFGHAQAAFMGAWPASLAQQQAGAEVVLAEVREVMVGADKKEAPHYYSYWVVLKDSPYQSLQDLKGKRVAFASQLSTSGFVAPLARLVELGLISAEGAEGADPKEWFGEVRFAGGYAQAWEALKAGQVDVALIAGDVPEKLYREVQDATRVIETQGPIPSHAVVFAPSLQEPLRSRLIQALLSLNNPENQPLMRRFISGIFVRFEPATGATHLSSLEQMLGRTGLQFAESKR